MAAHLRVVSCVLVLITRCGMHHTAATQPTIGHVLTRNIWTLTIKISSAAKIFVQNDRQAH